MKSARGFRDGSRTTLRDQTLEVLEELHREVVGVTHYAILAADCSITKLRSRRDELSRYGIHSLWFVPGGAPGHRQSGVTGIPPSTAITSSRI
jgi:hypothetical protein